MATRENYDDNKTVKGTSAADSIVNGGAGNDYIRNNSYHATLGSALTDNPWYYVTLNGGDSNDVIYGFNESSTLQIGDGSGTYSTVKSGSDILVSVGDDKITLRGAASLDTINIAGKDSTRLTLNNRSNAKQTIDAAIKTVDASTRPRRFVLQATSWRILCWAARAMIR